MWQLIGPAGTITIILVILIISGVRILKEYQRGVIFRLGRMVAPRGPGITYVIPVIEKMTRVDLRTVTMDLPPQDVITKDNVSVKVSAVLYFRVVDANRAIREVEHYLFATAQVAQVTLRSVCGQAELDELLAEREQIKYADPNHPRQSNPTLGDQSRFGGNQAHRSSSGDQRAMAKQAEAERERRAKIIHAQGEFEASQKLAAAAEIIAKQPSAIHLRFLQSLVQVAAENNQTLVLPVPIDIIRNLMDHKNIEPETIR